MDCKTCGQLPKTSTLKSPVFSTQQPQQPCCLPVIPNSVPKLQVHPNQPNRLGPCNCNYCVPPICQQPPSEPLKPKKKCKYIQPARPKSYAPQRQFVPPAIKMEDNTIYRGSYLPAEIDRPKPIKPESNICVGEGKMSDNTVNRMSYMPHKTKPPCPIYPCEHKMLGEGPIQDITTQKHDYVPKPYSKPKAVLPTINLFSSDAPLSDKTVNRLSYLASEINRVKPIYPLNTIDKPTGKISGKTVNKLSYQPWQPQEPVDLPWAHKPKYVPPKLRMDDNTVNRMSFLPPGEYVECSEDDPDCIDLPDNIHCFPKAAIA